MLLIYFMDIIDKTPLLSICIPTNGIVSYVLPVLDSIYSQVKGNDLEQFEVVIVDNGKGNDLEIKIKEYQYPNLRYEKTNAEGFLNQICCFNLAVGHFLKFQNHRAKFLNGTLDYLLNIVRKNLGDKPVIYLSNGVLGIRGNMVDFNSFDEFVRTLSYWSSWSSGVTIWRDDFVLLRNVQYNMMFPHTSLLFADLGNKKYVIDDKKLLCLQDDIGKGGYNLYKTFAVDYLDILMDLYCQDRISKKTFLLVKKDLWNFFVEFYFRLKLKKENYSFDLTGIKNNFLKYYSLSSYWGMVSKAWGYFLFDSLKKMMYKK